jgi:hypothetical protein
MTAVLCIRCKSTEAAGFCCKAHGKQLCHGCYRHTHFVEICAAGCTDCACEGLDPTKAVA